jgi:hypothetical protein
MRPVISFLSGLAAGLRSSAAGVKRRARRNYPKSKIQNPKSPGLPRMLGHLLVLLLATACVAAALTAAARGSKWRGFPGRGHGQDARATTLPPSAEELREVLATDPDAQPADWRYIVIHHSGTASGSAQSFDENHRRERGWRCLGYHFVIGNGNGQGDGQIVAGPRWYGQEWGAHANSNEYNAHGIGICLVGNMDEQPPTPAQWAATRALVAELRRLYDIPAANVVGHNQIRGGGSTACPGKFTPLEELREE